MGKTKVEQDSKSSLAQSTRVDILGGKGNGSVNLKNHRNTSESDFQSLARMLDDRIPEPGVPAWAARDKIFSRNSTSRLEFHGLWNPTINLTFKAEC